MKKAVSIVITLVMVLSCVFIPKETFYAANISLGVSASSIQIGDTVTATVSVPENVTGTIDLTFSNSVLEFSKASAEANVNGGTVSISIGKYGLAGSKSVTVTFKAKTSGTATLSAKEVDVYDHDTLEDISLGSASTTITVANKTADTGNSEGGGTSETQKSGDNSLASLKLSSGTLSPSFKYNVTKYTATVDYNVDSVVVSAKTSNAKATIESVTGNGNVKLNVGENTIQVVVKAENGVKATYTIVVTRKAQDATTPDTPVTSESESESQSESETTTPSVNEVLQWNGEQLSIVEEIPAASIPADFTATTAVIGGGEIPCLSFHNGALKVLYLNNTNGAGSLYVYDEADESIYPFIKISSETSYVMVLRPDVANAPDGFEACTFSIEGKGTISAYQLKETEETPTGTETIEDSTSSWNLFGAEIFYAAEAKTSDYYLIYCMNNDGELGWYMYDSVEGTFQRYLATVHGGIDVGSEENETTDLEEKYTQLEKELESAKMTQYIIIGVAVVVALVLIIVIIVLIMKKRSEEGDFYDEEEYDEEDYDDDDDYEESEIMETPVVEEVVVTEESLSINTMDETTEEDDDEVEIEFYEMEEPVKVSDDANEDDEIEIEFYEMEEPVKISDDVNEDEDDDLEFIDIE